ncbi:hypothetical protein Taro_054453 [Colocasia esculenta]|uniref:Uncharacterized protein n=1 Tax=Colocasia esculenta TaxID=4460 RepID=A0A843XQG9_COLES|nr:hypothetical protein [Colocasia esculenta]
MKKWSSGVDTESSSVDTSPSSQRTQLTGLYYVSTHPQVVSTLDPVPRRPVWQFWTCRHTLAETQNRDFVWTRSCLGIRGFDLGFCAHVLQGFLWTYGAINTHVLGPPKQPPRKTRGELSGKRQGERERGICIKRSRAAPPRGEEEEELEIAGVLVHKEIQPSL